MDGFSTNIYFPSVYRSFKKVDGGFLLYHKRGYLTIFLIVENDEIFKLTSYYYFGLRS